MTKTSAQASSVTNEEIQRSLAGSDWETRFPPLLTVEQAAELAGVPVGTIYQWSSRGLLDRCSKRFGRRLRIFRDRFLQLLIQE